MIQTASFGNEGSSWIDCLSGKYTPSELHDLAQQLTDLAVAHETIYPPTGDACAKAC